MAVRLDCHVYFFAGPQSLVLAVVAGQNIFDADFSIEVVRFVDFNLRFLGFAGEDRFDQFLDSTPQFLALFCHEMRQCTSFIDDGCEEKRLRQSTPSSGKMLITQGVSAC